MSAPPVILVDALRKSYGSIPAVRSVSFEVHAGEIFGLIGPNGAGKTTTMECVEGVRKRDGGQVAVLGLDPQRRPAALQPRIGVQLQEAQLQKRIKVWEAVDLWSSIYPRSLDGEALLTDLGLAAKRGSWFMNLSGGQKQRLFIALALVNDPEVVFLDELTTGLDPQARRNIWELIRGIRDRGKTVFLTTHSMEEAERLCDRVAIIDRGRVADAGSPEELIARHCPRRVVVFSSPWRGEKEAFGELPGLLSASTEGGRYRMEGSGPEFVSKVIELLAERAIRVDDLRTEHPGLEEVFLQITGHAFRD